MELLHRFYGEPDGLPDDARPRRTVAELLYAAATIRQERRLHSEAARVEEEASHAHEQALARDHEAAWERVEALIHTRNLNDYKAAVDILVDLQEIAERVGQTDEFAQQFTRLRKQHQRRPSFPARVRPGGARRHNDHLMVWLVEAHLRRRKCRHSRTHVWGRKFEPGQRLHIRVLLLL